MNSTFFYRSICASQWTSESEHANEKADPCSHLLHAQCTPYNMHNESQTLQQSTSYATSFSGENQITAKDNYGFYPVAVTSTQQQQDIANLRSENGLESSLHNSTDRTSTTGYLASVDIGSSGLLQDSEQRHCLFPTSHELHNLSDPCSIPKHNTLYPWMNGVGGKRKILRN
jgi:hypothetical protein